jgi:hypothetical protein
LGKNPDLATAVFASDGIIGKNLNNLIDRQVKMKYAEV